MGRQRKKSQSNRNEESSERILNKIDTSQLSDTEFKTVVITKLNVLTENHQKLQGNYEELTANYSSTKKGYRNNQQGPRANEEHNF